MKRNIATAFASIFAGRITALLSMALMTPILVRVLGESQYGVYATIISTFTLLMILPSSGINAGARKYLSEERDDDHWKSNVFGFYFRLAGAFALVVAVGLFLATQFGYVAATLGEKFVPYFYILPALALLSQFSNYVRRSLMGLKLEHVAEPIKVTFTIVFSVTAIAAAYLGYGVMGVLTARLFTLALVLVLAAVVVARNLSVGHILKPTPSSFPSWELFTFNYQSVVYMFMLSSLYHVDVIMLGMAVASNQVGFYKAALVLAEFLWFAPKAIQSVMVQSTSNLWAEGQTERISRLASRVTRYGLLFTLLLAIGIAALAPTFVPFYYGDAFAASVTPLWLLLPGALGFAVARPMLSISHAKGEMRPLIAATGASAAINLGLNALLIPRYGIAGAAIATSIGYGSLPLFQVGVARRLGFKPFADARLLRIGVTAVLGGVPIYLLATAIQGTLLALLVVPLVGFLVYSAAALLVGAVEPDEIFEILNMFPAPVCTKANALQQRLDI